MNIRFKSGFLLLAAAGLMGWTGCESNQKKDSKDSLVAVATGAAVQRFQKKIDGKQVDLYTLRNKNSAEATITNYGGRLVSLLVPDKSGKQVDVVAGFDRIEDYQNSTESYFGATIGRYGNRIAKGKFTLDGKVYTLFTNNGVNTLHGGKMGFQYVVWDAIQIDSQTLELRYLSKDMEEGFPGNLNVKVTYTLKDDNALQISYEATTDKNTVVNLTNHAFFNLNGENSGSILNHQVLIDADFYTPVDTTLIPTGKLEPVKGTPFDFTSPKTIGQRIDVNNTQLKNGKGYDHNYVLRKHAVSDPVATIKGDKTEIVMRVYTDQPGLQFYSGNFMQSRNKMKGNHRDDFRTAFALETQHFPDTPNQPSFPSVLLKPGEVYKSTSTYKFSVNAVN